MLIQKQYNKVILLEIWIEQNVQQLFIIEEAKVIILDFSQEPVRVL